MGRGRIRVSGQLTVLSGSIGRTGNDLSCRVDDKKDEACHEITEYKERRFTMNKDGLFEQVLSVLRKLSDSRILRYTALKGVGIKGCDHIAGVIGMVAFLEKMYISAVIADKEKQKILVDIDLMLCPVDRRYQLLQSYLVTLNLLLEYDCCYRFDSNRSVHLFTEISYADRACAPFFREIEAAVFNLLDLSRIHIDAITAIAMGRKVPVDRYEASQAFYKVMCDKDTVITPCFSKKPLTKVIGAEYEPTQRYIKLAQSDEEQNPEQE